MADWIVYEVRKDGEYLVINYKLVGLLFLTIGIIIVLLIVTQS